MDDTQQDSQAEMSNGGTGDIRTMEEFSAFVGLSRPTVSKYFNAPESVRPSTRQRIETAIEASGFTPNLFATNLKRTRTRVLGIIVPTATDPFYMELVRQVEELASRAGYVLFMLSSNGRADREVDAIARLESMNIAGAIVVPLGTQGPSARLASLERRSSIVYVDSAPDASTPFVGTDNAQSIGLMVEYLCRSGEPPGFLPMPPINRNAEARLAAYEEAMAQAHESPRVLAVPKRLDWDFERYGHEQTRHALEAGLPTRTILCANDRIALGALLAAWQANLHVGRTAHSQLRIAGHDDHPFARYSGPPLTTVSQDIQGIAQRTMATLLARIGETETDGGSMHETALFAGQLVLRDSA
ncbi:LacI family DNA-binding transcriptional regulator [Modicisalibacter radicis]|uniref:LacI family DNA-binding transcriptional regulator n=1 Tax=Halomonas sp. EAR18 TaxID=2518972 RepID=UPI001B34DFE6|nr:LacI family DNA-binding transcriptional regulator [Halomonas sp. EAR18]